ncbi:hypothetical protein MIND_00671200 [Mycena indigotica]|uniref:Uncharacterized protein n=1 Tax=Mycena indigotica TaxID=2126181 RepID=A0A8H6SLL4_9AGAR|nr:uncharacterized protein MIND_00671200 [Mycena indigotica]KAF7301072.1 hypothetical protein MIND_00671200 [Mycena indigotica]
MSTIVFLGAPPAADVHRPLEDYEWRTASSTAVNPSKSTVTRQHSMYLTQQLDGLPPATLEAVSRRISLVYQNVIFNDADEDDREDDKSVIAETFITWPPTVLGPYGSQSQSGDETHAPGPIPSFLDVSKSIAPVLESQFETQMEESQSYDHSGGDSIARFPEFHFSLNALTSLSALAKANGKGSNVKVSMLLAVLEVDGPDTFRFKKGKDAGKESFVLKMILGDEEGNVCKLTAWREVAEDWGGCGSDIGAKRGDVLLLTGQSWFFPVYLGERSMVYEDIMATYEQSAAVTLTASPWHKPKLEICYRTMPYLHEDHRLRPDLRLGASDACVRKVAAVVTWFENMAGLPAQ